MRDILMTFGLRPPPAISSPVQFSTTSATLDNPAAYRIGTNCWDRTTGQGPEYGRWDDGTALLELFTRTRTIRRGIIEAGQDTAAADFGRPHGHED